MPINFGIGELKGVWESPENGDIVLQISFHAMTFLTRLADSSLHHSTSTGRHEERRTATRDTRDARRALVAGGWCGEWCPQT